MSFITVDPRDVFENVFPIPKHVIRCGNGYACTEYSAWGAHDFIQKWEGWSAAMLQGADGNSPVIPDGWVACSERLPENKPGSYEYLVFETLNNGVHHDYWNVPDKGDDCQFTPFWNHYDRYVTHWMPLPAAPQQEVK
ncbi:DUF551 domain-containing protein [Enterobacter hormaechei]|nr:DUF551 domain-containing protein [Enterobacter hormaechei]